MERRENIIFEDGLEMNLLTIIWTNDDWIKERIANSTKYGPEGKKET